jgi:hypothetical protein
MASIAMVITIDIMGQTDFREVKWGMTIDQVRSIESAPLTKGSKRLTGYQNGVEYYDGIELIYEGVTIADEYANLTYYFKNGKLLQVRIVFVPTAYRKYADGIRETILMFQPLYDRFTSKGFKMTQPLRCGEHVYSGPDRSNPDNATLFNDIEWGFNEKALSLIDEMVSEKRYQAVFFKIENPRTRGSMMFLTEFSEWKKSTPVILELSPSFAIEKELEESDF